MSTGQALDDGPMSGAGRRRALALIGSWLAACVVCYVGWRCFWFLTDDAYIAFRYVSNRQLGYGYVWNAPPFLPVEGYSSFLWLLVLDAIWSLLGVEPPNSANDVALVCSWLSLALVALWLGIGKRGAARPLWMTAWALVLVASHRSFLVFASSGLEAALFDLLVLAWAMLTWQLPRRPRTLAPALAATTLLLALTRPDGLLFWSATCALLLLARARAWLSRRALLAAAPWLLGPALHLLWRHAYYGSWLPNPYYAKIAGVWPLAGAAYLAAFALEYGLWLWLPLVALACLRASSSARDALAPSARAARITALGTVCAHVGYYAIVAGGDHFEYRMLTQLVPLLALAYVWAVARLTARPWHAHALCALMLLAQSVLPYTSYSLSRGLNTRAQTSKLVVAVAPALPALLAPIARPFDALQAWLIPRGIAVRHQEHKVFALHQRRLFPTREQGLALRPRQPNPVMIYPCVGVPGWVLPRIAVLDSLGLNDYVVARVPLVAGARHYLAHERVPPPGYFESFMPDIQFGRAGKLVELARPRPLDAARIRAIEQRYRAIVDSVR